MGRLDKSIFYTFLLIAFCSCAVNKKYNFSYTSPETKGYSSKKIKKLQQHLEKTGSSAMIIMVEGDVIFEWGQTQKKHLIHSIRKAMLNSLYGIAIHDNLIDTTATLKQLKINDIEPELTTNELKAKISDLLKSRSGVYHNAAATHKGMLVSKPKRNSFKPNEHYYYNNWDFNVLGAVLEQHTKQSLYKMFKRKIALPLGMNDYKGNYVSIDIEKQNIKIPDVDGVYQYEKSKSKYPAYHFRMSARDLALYGQLYLNYGKWKGKQIISKKWIDESTKPHSIYNKKYGSAYGMLWKVRIPNKNTKRNSFYHTGLGIHMLGVYPDAKMVIVHRVNTEEEFNYSERNFYKMLSLVFNLKE